MTTSSKPSQLYFHGESPNNIPIRCGKKNSHHHFRHPSQQFHVQLSEEANGTKVLKRSWKTNRCENVLFKENQEI